MESGESNPNRLVLLIWAVIAAILMVIFTVWCCRHFNNGQLQQHLSWAAVLGIEASFIVMLTGLLLSWTVLKRTFSALSQNTKAIFGLILFVAIVLVGGLAPRTNRIYFDEHIYQNIAQTIAWTNRALTCNEGRAEYGEYYVFATGYNKEPNGFPFWLALFFRIFGVKEWVAHCANNVAYLIGIIAVFGIGLLLFESERVALFSAAFFAATPLLVIWSATVAAEPTAAAFSAGAIFAAALYARKPAPGTLLFAVGAIAFAITFRPESGLIVLPAALIILFLRCSEFTTPRLYWGLALLLLLSLPMFIHIWSVRMDNWGSRGAKFAFETFKNNILVNGVFYLDNVHFPNILALLMVVGLFVGGRWREKCSLLLWFLYSFGIFLFFYAGSYGYGADNRFSLISAAPLALFAGVGAAWFSSLAVWREYARAALLVMIIVLAGLWIKFLPFIGAVGREATEARADVEFGRKLSRFVPPDSIVFAHDPSMWLIWNRNAAQIAIAKDNQLHFENEVFQAYRGGVYLHWGYWCNVADKEQNDVCNYIRDHYDLQLVKEYNAFHYRYALYRVKRRGNGIEKAPPESGKS